MHFFLNYGGPGGYWLSDNNTGLTHKLQSSCKSYYGPPYTCQTISAHGLSIIVYSYGIHRALKVSIEPNPTDETISLFEEARTQAQNFCDKNYAFLKNNCVTAVGMILNSIDPNFCTANMIIPASFDQQIKKYCGSYNSGTWVDLFVQQYQNKVHSEPFSFFRKVSWAEKRINSATDIFSHAYGHNGLSGKRTKSILLKLNWITVEKDGELKPTSMAPEDFSKALLEFNNQTHSPRLNN
ncbi:MAG TPA: hypothetical protein PK657_07840 [Legionella sp.]|nr:hypothetical protein [Legionella sp.]